MKKQNSELGNRLGDCLVMVEEHKSAVAALRRDLDAQTDGEQEVYALRGRLSKLEKELLVYRVVMKCCVVVLLVVVCKAWM